MGQVAEFEQELMRRANSNFASWHAIDLHNHTPASEDYQYRGADVVDRLAEQIKSMGLSVVMFTDHNTLPDAELIKHLSDKTGRLILRGAELNVFVDAWTKVGLTDRAASFAYVTESSRHSHSARPTAATLASSISRTTCWWTRRGAWCGWRHSM